MNKVLWSKPVSRDEANRRASGRRQYNSVRQCQAAMRRVEVAYMLISYGPFRGAQASVARRLGVSESTISRDADWLYKAGRLDVCIECGGWRR